MPPRRQVGLVLAAFCALGALSPLVAGTITKTSSPGFTITLPDGWTDNPQAGQLANAMSNDGKYGYLLAARKYNVDLTNSQLQQSLMAGVVKAGGYPAHHAYMGGKTTFYFDSQLRINGTVYNACYYYLEAYGYLYCLTILSTQTDPEKDSELQSLVDSFVATG